ncbi:unnamed protein product [Moneuplotes crassus]|uniref:Uncharacterized protein n=1 Tax=Euplotes crassus TaxID=5936 RepID=A0AAD1UL20_EUPCR|nr:unnamed protein product [Moneuplotes crassus]
MSSRQITQTQVFFGLEKLETPAAKKVIFDSSQDTVRRIRNELLLAAKSEISHFNSLKCKFTVVKPQKEEVEIERTIILKKNFTFRASEGSTCMGSSKSVSDSDSEDGDHRSVSSDSDSSDDGLDDFLGEHIQLHIIDGKSGKVIKSL